MRVVSLHPDVLVATSRIWQTTCTIVRGGSPDSVEAGWVGPGLAKGGPVGGGHTQGGPADGRELANPVVVRSAGGATGDETFVIDSPILPDELEILPALLEQARFPTPSGLLVTHTDWDHMLGRLAFPETALGCGGSSAERMTRSPGAAQRELRAFDEEHYVQRTKPLALGSIQALDVPGSCEIGIRELQLHCAEGHTSDGMAVWLDWASVLVTGDYLSAVEIPVLGEGGAVEPYLQTLERLRPLVACAEHVVPGHGPILDAGRAMEILEEDLAYLRDLRVGGRAAELPPGRRTSAQRRIHAENVERALAG